MPARSNGVEKKSAAPSETFGAKLISLNGKHAQVRLRIFSSEERLSSDQIFNSRDPGILA
jgi:hypothetical protein